MSFDHNFDKHGFLVRLYKISLAVVGFYLILYVLLQTPVLKFAFLVGVGLLFLVGLWLTYRRAGFNLVSHYYIICCYTFQLCNIAFTGGVSAPGFGWFLLCPLIAFIVLSTRIARIWVAIVMITTAVFYCFDEILVFDGVSHGKLWYMASYVALFPVVYSIIRIFRREMNKKNSELTVINQKLNDEREFLQRTEQKLSAYLDQLVEIKRMEEVHNGRLEYSLQAILQYLRICTSLDNVVLWEFTERENMLERKGYSGNRTDFFEHATLRRSDFIEAFDMLQSGAIINGSLFTRESEQMVKLFKFSPGNDSMINCPYFLEGKFAGFISCRASGKKWHTEDIIFIRAVSDTISLAFKSHQKVVQQRQLEEKQMQVIEANESLERKVFERTQQLDLRNRQLTDLAFTNAHIIRGPICRLLGLQNVLSLTEDDAEIRKILAYIQVSIEELDLITRQTSQQLNKLIE